MRIRQKLDLKTIGYISTFEKITRTHAIDFFENRGQLTFLTGENTARKAIGRGGINIKKLSNMLNRKIRIIELTKDPKTFLISMIFPIKPGSIELEDSIITIKPNSTEDKARMIGREASNFQLVNSLLERHYKLKLKIK
tara:strand:+ start:674 stop:1090 length:417 start_codon:yes stop_codon:yes gene_type:complete